LITLADNSVLAFPNIFCKFKIIARYASELSLYSGSLQKTSLFLQKSSGAFLSLVI